MRPTARLASLTACTILAVGAAAGQIQMARCVLANGGNTAVSGDTLRLRATLGQLATGRLAGGDYGHGAGFWYVPVSASSGLADPGAPRPTCFALRLGNAGLCRSVAVIQYDVPIESRVIVRLHDVTGRAVTTPVDRIVAPGFHTARIGTGRLSAGIYFCRMEAGGFRQSHRLVLLR